VDISPPPGGELGPSTSGCEESDFTGFDEGDVAFLQRGTCTFEEKAKNAEAAGASAALILEQLSDGAAYATYVFAQGERR
jgi:hypothetical protein